MLLPGFVGARIMRMISAKSQQTELERLIEALIFIFFIYVFYVFLWGASLPLEWTSQTGAGVPPYAVTVAKWRLLSLVGIAIGLGFACGYVKGHHLLVLFLRKCGLTQRSSRESVWFDVFMNYTGYVQANLADGRSVLGWVKQYSEAGEERTLFLEQACWVIDGADPVDVPGDGMILLTEKADIRSVMFLGQEQQ